MRRELIPYYLSRAIMASLFSLLFSSTYGLFIGILVGLFNYIGFIWYAHSGHYLIDSSTPLFPLRRDARGEAIRDRAVVISVMLGGISYLVLFLATRVVPIGANVGSWVVSIGVIAYFGVSNWLFIKG